MKANNICTIFATFLVACSVNVKAGNAAEPGCDRDVYSEVKSHPSPMLELVLAKLERLEVKFNNLENQLDKAELRQMNRLSSLVCQIESKINPHAKTCENEAEGNETESGETTVRVGSDVTLREELAHFSDVIINNVTDSVAKLMEDSRGLEQDKYYISRGDLSEYHDIFGTGEADYRLAFRGTAHVGTSFYLAYRDGVGIPSPVDDGCKSSDFSQPCSSHYRSNDALDNWCNVEEVVFGIVDNKTLVKTIRFSGAGTTYMDWFQQKNLRGSPYVDLTTESKNYFSIDGDNRDVALRHFYINREYGGCAKDAGWVVVKDLDLGCSWESTFSTIPKLIYSGSDRYINWTSGNRKHADAFVIFVKYGNS